MTTDTKQNPAGERIEAPAKAWRNWYVTIVHYRSNQAKRERDVGEFFPADHVYPSKEIAEQKALNHRPKKKSALGRGYIIWVGAFPEGQRP